MAKAAAQTHAKVTQTHAKTHDTTGDQVVPPGSEQDEAHLRPADTLQTQVSRLEAYLRTRFPHEVDRTNVQRAEKAVDVAIRLLDGLTATHLPPEHRCAQEYCNKAQGHADECGWINAG